jgi:5-methylcytosine-specific restriction enzyme A
MARSELTRQEILQAAEEYDRLGREAFLNKYGFGHARSYLLVHDGKTYDSKATVGAAHGFLPGRSALTAADFSGGAATVGRLLTNLGFEVRTHAGTT